MVVPKNMYTTDIPSSGTAGIDSRLNPKDVAAMGKPNMFLLPPALKVHAALALQNGAVKYGAFNWRSKDVLASVYISALERHLEAWKDGEECAPDSGVHHLGHAVACLAILLDAQANGCLADDRPAAGNAGELMQLKSRV